MKVLIIEDNRELAQELREVMNKFEVSNGQKQEVSDLLSNLHQNLSKIHHGKRADAIAH